MKDLLDLVHSTQEKLRKGEKPKREVPSEQVKRVQEELRAERERSYPIIMKSKGPPDVSREELLKMGFVKARLRKGPDKSWVLFTIPEWTAMTVDEHMKYECVVDDSPGNYYALSTKARKRQGTLVLSSLSAPKRY